MYKYILFIMMLINTMTIPNIRGNLYAFQNREQVKFIHNKESKWGDCPEIKLEFFKSIGSINEQDPNLNFYKVWDIMLDKEGNKYIVDLGNERIQKFDKSWNYMCTIGRSGQGPGEFLVPSGVEIDNDNNLNIINYHNMRIEVMTLNGEFVRFYRLKRIFDFFRFIDSGLFLTKVTKIKAPPGFPGSGLGEGKLISIINSKGEIVDEFCDFTEYNDTFLNLIANKAAIEIGSNNDIFVAYLTKNLIEKYSINGELLLQFDRKLPYNVKKANVKNTGGSAYRETWFKDVTFISVCLGFDYKDRLWVLSYFTQPGDLNSESAITYKYPEKMHFELFDNDGVLLGNLDTPNKLVMLRIIGDSVFFTDAYQVTVHEYKIIEQNR
ncbi:6-bladed beta-propeller [candidate division KSB1 bacterium]